MTARGNARGTARWIARENATRFPQAAAARVPGRQDVGVRGGRAGRTSQSTLRGLRFPSRSDAPPLIRPAEHLPRNALVSRGSQKAPKEIPSTVSRFRSSAAFVGRWTRVSLSSSRSAPSADVPNAGERSGSVGPRTPRSLPQVPMARSGWRRWAGSRSRRREGGIGEPSRGG